MTEPVTTTRLALLFSDGSVGILSASATLEQARRDRECVDLNERNPHHLTKIARVEFTIVELVEAPPIDAPPETCPHCGAPHHKEASR